MTIGYIHSKESFGTVDGPGIRYVLFLQGCPMRCLYCHNPDTWTKKGGTPMSVEQVLDEYGSYRPFLKDGGITLSGGEPLLQMDFVIELFKKAKSRHIHTTLDTSGITFDRDNASVLTKFKELIKYTDLFMLDIKHIDTVEHKILTGHRNERILDFLSFLNDNHKNIWIRHVIVPGITYKKEQLIKLGYELAKYEYIRDVDILPYHSMAKKKYEELKIDYKLKDILDLSIEDALKAKKIVLAAMKKKKLIDKY